MNNNVCIKITFSKLNCEEISSKYLCCNKCDAFDIPEDAEVISICFAPKHKRCPECDLRDSSEEDEVDIIERYIPRLPIKPAFPEYYIEGARLQSFDGWPKTMKQTGEQLSAAGFFYTHKEDRVICFCCGGGLYKWEEHDEAWEQHALHHGECDYVRVMKGSKYVASVKEKFSKSLQ